jgi:stage II sporulation protein M
MILTRVKNVLSENRSWIYIAMVIFTTSAVLFYIQTPLAPAELGSTLEHQLEEVAALLEVLLTMNPFVSALFIFINNFISMAQMLVLGVIAGISPLFTIGLNGAVIGMLLSVTSMEGVPLLPAIILGILPHGIFELFAFFLCGALGLKFGYHCIASPLPGKTRLQSYRYIWKEVISVLPLVTILLFVAALIEIIITPRLLGLITP